MIANSAPQHMCVVLCQQHAHNYLITKPAGSALSLVSPGTDHAVALVSHATLVHLSGPGDDNE